MQEAQSLSCVAASADVELVASGYSHAAICVHDLAAMPRAELPQPGTDDAAVGFPEYQPEASCQQLWAHHGPVYGLAFSFDKRVLYSCGADGTVRMWYTPSGIHLLNWEGHNAPAWDVAACPMGHWVVSAGADWTLKLWCAPHCGGG